MLALDILLQMIGAFYMFAGIVLARAVMMDRLITGATDAIIGSRMQVNWQERARTLYAIVLATMTYLSGLGLMSLCDLAVYLFIATMLVQALFLFWLAPQYLDTPEISQSRGRQQSTNALVVFSAATAFVTWAASIGRLQPVMEASATSLLMVGGLVAVFLGYVGWMYVRTRIGTPR
jgi:hypothetical protein